jgi:hypothetical protein
MALKPEISSELRGMVREVLREVVGQRGQPGLAAIETVRLANDQDLAAFVAWLSEPATAERVRAGKLRFTLGGGGGPAALPAASTLTGVITEQKITRLASTGVVVLGPGAVLTPLARDRARRLGLKIERRS